MTLQRLLWLLLRAWCGGLAVDRALTAPSGWALTLCLASAVLLAGWLLWSIRQDWTEGRIRS